MWEYEPAHSPLPSCTPGGPIIRADGRVAAARNGNITNAIELRAELERRGSIFQANSDTEVILHLVAHSSERTLAGALRDALLQIEGAFSLAVLAEDRIIVARDPHGFRPRAMGRMELNGHTAYVFASEPALSI